MDAELDVAMAILGHADMGYLRGGWVVTLAHGRADSVNGRPGRSGCGYACRSFAFSWSNSSRVSRPAARPQKAADSDC
jgi:hypothetical protein